MAESCLVLQSLIFMMLGHMGETQTDEIPVQFMILFDFDISAWMLQFYIYIFKGLIDKVILYSQTCIRKCNITAYFLSALNVGAGLNLNGISM